MNESSWNETFIMNVHTPQPMAIASYYAAVGTAVGICTIRENVS